MNPSAVSIRPWRTSDAASCQRLIVTVLREYGLQPDPDGVDADVMDVEWHYRTGGGDFFVVTQSDEVIGTMGVARINELVCELRKMYLLPEARGQGLGRQLLALAERHALSAGFQVMQLETASVLKEAIALYERNGYQLSDQPLHTCRCDKMYQKKLSDNAC